MESIKKTNSNTNISKQEFRAPKKSKHRFKVWFLIILIFLFSFSLFIARNKSLQIKEIKVVSTKAVDPDIVKDFISEKISGHYLFFYNKSSIFIYPENEIKKDFFLHFPRLYNVDLKLKNKELIVTVAERLSYVTYCKDVLDLDNECYFVDKDGNVFAQAPTFVGSVYTKIYFEPARDDIYISNDLLPSSHFQNLKTYIDEFSVDFKKVPKIIIQDKMATFYINKGNTDEKFLIYVDLSENVSSRILNLKSSIDNSSLGDLVKKNISDLYSIDLRYPTKLYYKRVSEMKTPEFLDIPSSENSENTNEKPIQ